jgi:glutamate dehydrogenase
MTEAEFLKHKDAYVRDVLHILEKRAEAEAKLIFEKRRRGTDSTLYTEISDAISTEINNHYARLFAFFQARSDLADQALFRKVLLNHLPAFIRKSEKFRARVKKLPPKIKFAILASEIASMIVYNGGWEMDFESRLRSYLKANWGHIVP